MKLTIYQIDAFSEEPFKGNPAAIVPLKSWLPDLTLQSIAEENNLSETAFFVPNDIGFHIRWFTPKNEVELCGHATLASAYVIFNILNYNSDKVHLNSQSGRLSVSCYGDLLTLDFPSQKPEKCDIPKQLLNGLNKMPISCYKSEDYLAVFKNEKEILDINPDFNELKKLDLRGIIITAKGSDYDFVSRFFVPKYGIDEDPVTGSAHTQLTPFWSEKLGKKKMSARQISRRGGNLICEQKDDRVFISGKAVKYFEGEINI